MMLAFYLVMAGAFLVLVVLNVLQRREIQTLRDPGDLLQKNREDTIFCLVFLGAMAWFAYARWIKI